MKLTGKVALITGGGCGIGRAIALAYAKEGAAVAICARTASEVEKVTAELRALQPDGAGWPCDVSLEEPVRKLLQEVKAKLGRIDVLVNNAGLMTRAASTAELDVKKWDYALAVNLRGPFLVTQAALAVMIPQRSGSIINVSSAIGRSAYPQFIAYAASTWGLEGFTQALAAELRPNHIRVNSVDPGTVATKLTGFMGRQPESVTDVFVFLASEESKSVTGKMLDSSGWKSQLR